jgi:hypothetical protein
MSENPYRPPVWPLDVDVVVNATRPGWSAAPRRATACADGDGWRLRWAPALIGRIRTLHVSGTVEVRWATTWCAYATQLERMWRLPLLERAFTGPLVGAAAAAAKLAAARRVVASGWRLVWSDDEVVPSSGTVHDELTAGSRALLIAPASNRGLQPEHLDAIEAFAVRRPAG